MSTETDPPETAAKDEPTNGDAEAADETQDAPPSASASNDDDVDMDDGEEEIEEGAKEEDELFANIEKEEESRLLASPESKQQPKEVEAAPKLLQKALADGQVQASDSEQDSENGKKPSSKQEENGEGDKSAQPSGHQRGNQLDFLLSKAHEYSNFIARDLDDLQNAMAEKAKKTLAKMEKKKKRKGSDGKKGSAKKAKTNEQDAIFVQPPNLAKGCRLKDYQLEGVRWLASLFENGVSGILADEMGLGKTIQCVSLIAHLLTKQVSGPFLVVAPLATLPNWVREFEKWLPDHPVVRYHGPAAEREAMMKGPLNPKLKRNADFPFIVTSFEVAIRDQSKLEKLTEYTYLIVDEGHRLKNHRCTLLTSLKRLKAGNRLLLTGTPIQNTLDELWSLLNFVNPQIFDDLTVFQSWFGFKDIGQKNHGATDEQSILLEQRKNQTVTKLHSILRPFLLRRIKTDVLKDMPPKKEVIVYSGISKLQEGYADLIEKGTLRDSLIQQGIESGRTLSQTNKMMNHRKNINHPFLFGEPIDPATGSHVGTVHPQLLVRASGKFALLDRMLDRLFNDGHQVLIFSQMTSVLNVMEDYLRFRNWKYCRIDGTTQINDRQKQMDQFNAEKTGDGGKRNKRDDRYFVFLLSTRAGGLGINLTAADTCIIFDSDWNPHADSQAMDRCHRIGQTLPVAVYRLITVNSVDIEMMEKQMSKKKLERMTIAGGDFRKGGRRSRGDEISFEGLQSLLQSDVKDLDARGEDVENIAISDEEFESIMDRKKLFATGDQAIATEGKMYDVIEAEGGDVLGSMDTGEA